MSFHSLEVFFPLNNHTASAVLSSSIHLICFLSLFWWGGCFYGGICSKLVITLRRVGSLFHFPWFCPVTNAGQREGQCPKMQWAQWLVLLWQWAAQSKHPCIFYAPAYTSCPTSSLLPTPLGFLTHPSSTDTRVWNCLFILYILPYLGSDTVSCHLHICTIQYTA
jgi:hypothetical protein